jgi:hypothetical protein
MDVGAIRHVVVVFDEQVEGEVITNIRASASRRFARNRQQENKVERSVCHMAISNIGIRPGSRP